MGNPVASVKRSRYKVYKCTASHLNVDGGRGAGADGALELNLPEEFVQVSLHLRLGNPKVTSFFLIAAKCC